MSRIAQPSWLVGMLTCLFSLTAFAQSSGKMSIVGGTGDAVRVTVKDKEKADDYFRILPGGERLLVVAEGPATLSIRFRAAATGRSTGTLRVFRDDGPFSDNPYELARDMSAQIDLAAAAEGNAASVERVLHVRVEEGEHRYEIAPVKGPPLLVRVFKTSKYDPALATAPEKNTNAMVTSTPVETPAPAPVRTLTEPTPAPELMPATIGAAPETIERVSAEPEPQETPTIDVDLLQMPATLDKLPEKPVIPPDPNKHKGFSASLRGGGHAFLGFSRGGGGGGAFQFSKRIWGKIPIALELAYNFNPRFGIFLEGGFVKGVRPHSAWVRTESLQLESEYRIIPAMFGLTYFVPIGQSRFGFRFRAGAGLAYAESRSRSLAPGHDLPGQIFQSGWGATATAGGAAEFRFGPGRFTLEARYLMIRTDVGLHDPTPAFDINAVPKDLGGLQVLGGYRFQF